MSETGLESKNFTNADYEIQESKKELSDLKSNIVENPFNKDVEKFERLVEDVDVKNGLKKIFDKCCSEAFEEERKNFQKINVSKTLDNLLNKRPDLRFYITGILKLPLGTTNFSELTNEQKINFCSLINSLERKSRLQPKKIVDRCDINLKNAQEKINKIFKQKNISNRLQLKKTLTKDFGLNNNEAEKIEQYLSVIKSHPEYVGMYQVQECGIGKFGWGIIVGIVTTILAGLGIHYIANIGKPNTETLSAFGETVIDEPKSIAKLLTQSSEFSTSGHSETTLLKENEDDGLFKGAVKKIVNNFETDEIWMEMKGELVLVYDFNGSEFTINHDTGEAILKIKEPDVDVVHETAKVTKKNGEVFELSCFDNDELILEEQLKQQAIDDAKKDPAFYEKAKAQTEENILAWCKQFHPYGADVKSVKVEYFRDITINGLDN